MGRKWLGKKSNFYKFAKSFSVINKKKIIQLFIYLFPVNYVYCYCVVRRKM